MSGYVYSIVCVAAGLGIVGIMSPSGAGSGLKKHLKLVCALFLLCVLISPLADFIDTVKELFPDGGTENGELDREALRESYESIYDSYLEGGYGESLEVVIKKMLSERFGIPKEECRALIDFSEEDGVKVPKRITLIFKGGAVFRDPKEIKKFVSETFGCECRCAAE